MSNTGKELAALKEAISEARTLIKDLKFLRTALQKDRKELEELHSQAFVQVKDYIGSEVEKGLADYRSTLLSKIDEAQQRVDKRFDKVVDIMLGEKKTVSLL